MDILHKILDAMWKQGYSDADFCRDVGINKSAVTDWKKGKTKSYMKHLPIIADVLGVSIDYLTGNDVSSTKEAILTEQPLTEKQETVLKLAKQLSDEDMKKLIDYAELLKKADNQ